MSARRCTNHHRRTPVHPTGISKKRLQTLWGRRSAPRGAVEPVLCEDLEDVQHELKEREKLLNPVLGENLEDVQHELHGRSC